MFGICLASFFGKCIKESCEPTLPAGYHGNWRLEEHDSQLVREGKMTQRQFMKNMDNGKYYAPTPKNVGLDQRQLRMYYGMRWRGTFNLNCDYGEYNFIKNISQEEAKQRYLEMPYIPPR